VVWGGSFTPQLCGEFAGSYHQSRGWRRLCLLGLSRRQHQLPKPYEVHTRYLCSERLWMTIQRRFRRINLIIMQRFCSPPQYFDGAPFCSALTPLRIMLNNVENVICRGRTSGLLNFRHPLNNNIPCQAYLTYTLQSRLLYDKNVEFDHLQIRAKTSSARCTIVPVTVYQSIYKMLTPAISAAHIYTFEEPA
jgi:hypothetical protein